MRVAFVATGGLDPSGRERVIPALVSLVERTARRHVVVAYVLRYYDTPRRYPLGDAIVQDLGRPQGIRRQYGALVGALRRDGPFDLLHAYWGLPAGFVAAVAGRRLRRPSIVTLDAGEFVGLPDIGYGLQLRRRQRVALATACRLAMRVTVCSHYQEKLARESGIRAEVVQLGIDTSVFTPGERAEGPPWRLIHVASLNRVKDQRLLVDTLSRLQQTVPDVHLDIVGEDTLNGEIQRLVAGARLERHVTFHGFQPSEALVPLYRRAHLAVLTSRHEAAGVVTLEAAACGVPTIGTNVGYVADLAPRAAIAVEGHDPGEFAATIARALNDRSMRESVAAAARDWTLAHDADWTAAAFDRLYHATAG